MSYIIKSETANAFFHTEKGIAAALRRYMSYPPGSATLWAVDGLTWIKLEV